MDGRKLSLFEIVVGIAAIVACIAAVLVVPEFRQLIGLDKSNSTSPDEPIKVLNKFLTALSTSDFETAYTYVAPSSKISGDPIAYNAPLDYNSFVNEITGTYQYINYELGDYHWESDERFYIWINFSTGDNDEALLILEDGQWYVADPIHIVR